MPTFENKKDQRQAEKINLQKHIASALSYEEDKERMYKRSNKIAWVISGISSFMTVALTGALITLLPLKEKEPMLLVLDRSTGVIEYQSKIDPNTVEQLEGKEQLDKYFVNQYIQSRESYTYQTIQKTYELTQLLSSDSVAEQYRKEYDRADSLDQRLKTGTATVQVISITLEKIQEENIATARIQVTELDDKKNSTVKNYTIRLSYEYKPEVKLSISNRIDNPVGFFVTSYQRVQENL